MIEQAKEKKKHFFEIYAKKVIDDGKKTCIYSFHWMCDGIAAGWQSGYAEDCKSFYIGSIPVPASTAYYSGLAQR